MKIDDFGSGYSSLNMLKMMQMFLRLMAFFVLQNEVKGQDILETISLE